MPRVQIWVRKEDWPAFESIVDRPAWIHEMLSMDDLPDPEPPVAPVVDVPDEARKPDPNPLRGASTRAAKIQELKDKGLIKDPNEPRITPPEPYA